MPIKIDGLDTLKTDHYLSISENSLKHTTDKRAHVYELLNFATSKLIEVITQTQQNDPSILLEDIKASIIKLTELKKEFDGMVQTSKNKSSKWHVIIINMIYFILYRPWNEEFHKIKTSTKESCFEFLLAENRLKTRLLFLKKKHTPPPLPTLITAPPLNLPPLLDRGNPPPEDSPTNLLPNNTGNGTPLNTSPTSTPDTPILTEATTEELQETTSTKPEIIGTAISQILEGNPPKEIKLYRKEIFIIFTHTNFPGRIFKTSKSDLRITKRWKKCKKGKEIYKKLDPKYIAFPESELIKAPSSKKTFLVIEQQMLNIYHEHFINQELYNSLPPKALLAPFKEAIDFIIEAEVSDVKPENLVLVRVERNNNLTPQETSSENFDISNSEDFNMAKTVDQPLSPVMMAPIDLDMIGITDQDKTADQGLFGEDNYTCLGLFRMAPHTLYEELIKHLQLRLRYNPNQNKILQDIWNEITNFHIEDITRSCWNNISPTKWDKTPEKIKKEMQDSLQPIWKEITESDWKEIKPIWKTILSSDLQNSLHLVHDQFSNKIRDLFFDLRRLQIASSITKPTAPPEYIVHYSDNSTKTLTELPTRSPALSELPEESATPTITYIEYPDDLPSFEPKSDIKEAVDTKWKNIKSELIEYISTNRIALIQPAWMSIFTDQYMEKRQALQQRSLFLEDLNQFYTDPDLNKEGNTHVAINAQELSEQILLTADESSYFGENGSTQEELKNQSIEIIKNALEILFQEINQHIDQYPELPRDLRRHIFLNLDYADFSESPNHPLYRLAISTAYILENDEYSNISWINHVFNHLLKKGLIFSCEPVQNVNESTYPLEFEIQA